MTTFAFSAPLRREQHVTAPILGGLARLRPLLPGEVDVQREVFAGLSASSRTDRFLTSVDRLTASMWRALDAVDGHDHVAWLASVDDRPVGIGRFVRVEPCTAEVAFEVVDEHHGRGIGTALLDVVTTVAAAKRIRRLQATVLGTNRSSQRLLARVGLAVQASGGLLEADSPYDLLDPARVDRPAVLRLNAEAYGGELPLSA
jgi:RimJ/RimL family protein N-acetyltransferase